MEELTYREFLAQIEEKAYIGDIPFHGSFELTPLCNLNCKMCYVHQQNSSVINRILSKGQWISVIQEAINHGMLDALLTGGEALMYPWFWDIYLFLIEHGITTRVKTNGLLLNEASVYKFKEYPPFQIDISLYGCNSDSYLAVTGVDVYDQIMKNIRMAISIGLNVQIMVTPSRYMLPWVEQVLELAHSLNVRVLLNGILIKPDENTGRKIDDYNLTIEEDRMIKEKYREIFPRMSFKEDHDLFINRTRHSELSGKGLYCNAGRTGFAIKWDGIMVPCLEFPRDVLSSDIQRHDFDYAWEKINQQIKEYEIPKTCLSCDLNSKCHYCPMLHKKVAAKHLCDNEVCKHIRYLTMPDI